MSKYSAAIAALLCVSLLEARQDKLSCGTHPDRWREEAQLHENAAQFGVKRLRKAGTARLMGEREVDGRTVRPDSGSIAILDDSDGVVSRRNAFNLNRKTIRFTPQPNGYKYAVEDESYDTAAAMAGSVLTGLGDDDARQVTLPFPFPYFGKRYDSVFVNSDGNLTFTAGDPTSSDRSLGRMTSGPPRISALFRDLDPTRATGGVRTTSSGNVFVITWDNVPEYRDIGTGTLQTFQIRLYPDGKIEIAYSDVNTTEAVVGIAPGSLQGSTSVVSFLNSPTGEGSAAITERFSASEKVDIFSAAQKFYLNHEDTYDYLVFFNTLGIA
ncbi:MAG TPA: hypothetical protein VF135_11505, partial [Terriglobales bacterium]